MRHTVTELNNIQQYLDSSTTKQLLQSLVEYSDMNDNEMVYYISNEIKTRNTNTRYEVATRIPELLADQSLDDLIKNMGDYINFNNEEMMYYISNEIAKRHLMQEDNN